MYHLALDFRLYVYALRSWSAKSTPPVLQLYSLMAIGQEKSAELPSGSLRYTTVFSLGSQIVRFSIPPHKAMDRIVYYLFLQMLPP